MKVCMDSMLAPYNGRALPVFFKHLTNMFHILFFHAYISN